MPSAALKPWIEQVALHPDVLSDSFSEDIFALDLGPLADRVLFAIKSSKEPPVVYRDPEQFFRASYLTSGLRSLLQDVLERLTGRPGNPVLKLLTPFGGGKSHTLAALLHAAHDREALNVIPEGRGLPDPGKVRIAAIDGQFFGATTGKEVPGEKFRARTMWGWIAWSLGGKDGYEMLRAEDEARVAPGGDTLLQLLAKGPNLLLLDEVLEYLISAGGIKVEKTTLRDETLSFLKRLTVAVANTANTALVFSLQSSKRESLEYLNILQTVDHLAARKDQRREPVEGNEILSVIQRRLLAKLPEPEASKPVATAYQEIVTQMRRAYAQSESEKAQAEEEGIALRDRIRTAYPFHPALIDLMRERWAAIPDFQRTRGALRFLASCLRAAHRAGKSRAILGPGDVPLEDSEARLAFFKEVGQREDFAACIEHDFIGQGARTRRIDERRTREIPSEAGKRPAARLATAILMYSFGGLRRDSSSEGDLLPPGVTEAELLSVCVGPELDSTTAQACLKELKEQCLYLHFDGARYCFKKDPNVTLLIEQEADLVARDESRVRTRIREMLEERMAGQRNAVIWPTKTDGVPDHEASFLVAYMPLEFVAKAADTREREALEFFEKCGNKQRDYRNGLGLAVPSEDQIETLRRSVRYLLAIEHVRGRAKQLNLTDAQRDQLRERESTERAAAESALLKLYAEVWLPRAENGSVKIEEVATGGRPLQTTLNEKRQARIHDRMMELLDKKVFGSVMPSKIVSLFKLGDGSPPQLGVRTSEVVAGFYSFLGFPRLTTMEAIRRAVADGVQKGVVAYATGTPALGANGKFAIERSRVAFERQIGVDEVDLDAGFIMFPSALPVAATASTSSGAQPEGGKPAGAEPAEPSLGGGKPATPQETTEKSVQVVFEANRDELYTAWSAIANLADLAGKVKVSVSAISEKGFDKNRLENGVLEPLRETKLID